MYLTIDSYSRYWLFSDTKASAQSSTFIEEQFECYDYHYFNPSKMYRVENNSIIRIDDNSIDYTILLELPNDYTYEQFIQTYPEMLL